MKLLSILVATVALLSGCAGNGLFETSGYGDPGRMSLRDQNPLNDPANPTPYYGG